MPLVPRYQRRTLAAFVGLLLASATAPVEAASPADCRRLQQLDLPRAKITTAEWVAAGPFEAPDGTKLAGLPAFCRIAGSARPTADSDIKFEVWLPGSSWTGRLWGVGNGGWAGSISYRGLARRLLAGQAGVATDTGHEGDEADITWAVGHPERLIDFASRGLHASTVAAKRIVQAFYDRKQFRSYFGGCSNGGREALVEATRYPGDYDGIIAGDPGANLTKLYVGDAAMHFLWLSDPAHALSPAKLASLHKAALAACGSADSVAKGYIADPEHCRFDPGVLACTGADGEDCPTLPEIATARNLYDGAKLPSGVRVYRGYAPGSELGWEELYFTPKPQATDDFADNLSYFRNLVFADAAWDWHGYDPARDGAIAERKLGTILNQGPDLGRFVARGAKLILYQGWDDPIVPAFATVDYFRAAVAALGSRAGALRLFMVPGMDHCAGGPGPTDFGQPGGGAGDPGADIGAALEHWVEQGAAPERILARHRSSDDDPASPVLWSRPLCAYPRHARYLGTGPTDDVASFECVADK